MFRYMSLIALILWATSSTAAIQNSDFWFHDDGDMIFIDGKRGAPLHIDYIGAPLKKPLTVKVTPDNPKLKIAAPTCTFTKKDDDCKLIVHNAKEGDNIYGVNQFTLTEIGGSRVVFNDRATSEASTVGFGVGVQGKDMPAPAQWNTWFSSPLGGSGMVVLVNATNVERKYMGAITGAGLNSDYRTFNRSTPTYTISLPSKSLCYVDEYVANPPLPSDYAPFYVVDKLYQTGYGRYFSDVTNSADPIYNAAYQTGNNNLSTCAANGQDNCASNKWASWTMGVANLGTTDMTGGVRAGQIEVLRIGPWNNGTTIYYKGAWTGSDLALLLIQGSIDGSGFDVNAAAPSILQLKSAAPCSSYVE